MSLTFAARNAHFLVVYAYVYRHVCENVPIVAYVYIYGSGEDENGTGRV